jgi:hypothetical protein
MAGQGCLPNMALRPPQSLVQHLRQGRCVLFAGSGLSAWAGLPTWSALLRDLIAEMRAEQIALEDLDEMDRLVDAGKLLEVAEHCSTQLGNRYTAVLSERLVVAPGEIPEPHEIIVRLPFSGVVTTNYDNLLERAYQKRTSTNLKAPTHEDGDVLGTLLFDGSFFVLKAHGSLDRPATLVLTASDYRDILHSNPAFTAFFSSILMSKALLFVGYSLNDPDFRMLIDRQLSTFQRFVPERYALIPGVGAVESKVMWENLRIRVLTYTPQDGRHDEMVEFLRELERLVGEPTSTPTASEPAPEDRLQPTTTRVARTLAPTQASTLALLSLWLEGGELVSTLERPGGPLHAGRGPMPDALKLARMWPDSGLWTEPESKEYKVASALSESVGTILERLPAIVPPGEVVLLSVERQLEAFPWEWLIVEGGHLVLRNPVVRTPASGSQAARGYPVVRTPPSLLLIGDPGGEGMSLPGARDEVERIANAWQSSSQVVSLYGADASIGNVLQWIGRGESDVIHFAGHAWFDAEEHYLYLADGMLRASELRSLLSASPPALVFLNSHYTAFVPPFARVKEQADAEHEVSAAGQLRLMDCAMAAGCGTFVGCLSSPTDEGARDIAIGFYSRLLAGERVARAFHSALASTLAQTPFDAIKYVITGSADVAVI